MFKEQILFAHDQASAHDTETPKAIETVNLPEPTITYHEINLQFGTAAYHAATVDIGFGVPTGNLNIVEASPDGLANDQSLLAHDLQVHTALAKAKQQLRDSLRIKGASHVEVVVTSKTYVNEAGKTTNGFFLYAYITLTKRLPEIEGEE